MQLFSKRNGSWLAGHLCLYFPRPPSAKLGFPLGLTWLQIIPAIPHASFVLCQRNVASFHAWKMSRNWICMLDYKHSYNQIVFGRSRLDSSKGNIFSTENLGIVLVIVIWLWRGKCNRTSSLITHPFFIRWSWTFAPGDQQHIIGKFRIDKRH